jgi:hypothetical protein
MKASIVPQKGGKMARKRQTPEQVINKLREEEVAIAKGSTMAEDFMSADPVCVLVRLT